MKYAGSLLQNFGKCLEDDVRRGEIFSLLVANNHVSHMQGI